MGWSGACSGIGGCTVTLDQNKVVTATFNVVQTPICKVPNVVGMTLARAKTKIRRAHCSIGKITRKASTARKRNHVLAQRPRPGRQLAAGAKVNLTVGKGRRR